MRLSVISFTTQIRGLLADERGAISVIMGVLLIPLVGALAIGFEVSNWYMTTRDMQNAADAAAMAAATNAKSNYDIEAKAVAARYGFVDGANTVTVAASNTAACPDGTNACYSVTITGFVPLLMSQIVGFQGDAIVNGTREKRLSSVAVARPSTPEKLCMVALASSGAAQGIRTNGAPVANMNGCNVMSNTNAQCNGSNLGAGFGLAHGTSSGCGVTPVSNVPVVTDPYSSHPALGPSPCGPNFPQQTSHGNTSSGGSLLPTTLNLSPGNNYLCGDQRLAANTIINAPSNSNPPAVLIVENGQLDLYGHSLTTSNNSAVT